MRVVTPWILICSVAWPAIGAAAPAGPYESGLHVIVSTLLGSSDVDETTATAVDPAGNLIAAGRTCGTDLPRQVDLRTQAGLCDVFVVKIARNGSVLLASTLIGGGAQDEVTDVAVDAAGNIFLTGTTNSPTFPTLNAAQATRGGAFDAFVVKLDPTASHLIWGTWLGGTGDDTVSAIAVDQSGNAWVLGLRSNGVPDVRPLQPRPSPGGPFVARLLPDGTLDLMSSVSGVVSDITIDPAGRACIVGHDPSGILIQIVAADGGSIDQSTRFGSPGQDDQGLGIAAAPDGDLIVTGRTSSSTLATPGAYDVTPDRDLADFVARIAPFTSVPRWVTYVDGGIGFGGTLTVPPMRVAVTSRGEPILVGTTDGNGFTAVPAAAARPHGFVLRSGSGGRSFSRTDMPDVVVRAPYPGWRDMSLAFDAGDPAVLYGATPIGSFVSRDAGLTWQPLINFFKVIVTHPARPGVLFASDWFNVHASADGGTSWLYRGPIAPTAPHILALAVDPNASETVYAGTDGDGLYRSLDGARTWQALNAGLPVGRVSQVVTVPSRPGHLYAIVNGVVYMSTNFGASWGLRSNGLLPDATALAVAPGDPSTLYAIASAAVWRSNDAGAFWEMVSLPRPGGPLALAVHPTDARIVFIATPDTIYRSTDGGRTLLRPSQTEGLDFALWAELVAVHPSRPDVVYAFSFNRPADAFIRVLSADGTRLLASQAFGGTFDDAGAAVATGSRDEIWIGGSTLSSDFAAMNAVSNHGLGNRDGFVVRLDALADGDGDALPTAWELQFGLDPDSPLLTDGATGDPDGDGKNNLEERQAGSHPRGLYARYFAEGAASGFFDTRLALLAPSATPGTPDPAPATVLLRFQKGDGGTTPHALLVPTDRRVTLDVKDVPGMTSAEFSTIVESDREVVVDRTMSWDVGGYGSHAETGIAAPAVRWYLAEGATHSGFELFYLVQNPNDETIDVQVTFLLPTGTPVEKAYAVPPNSRFTIWVDLADPRLASTDVSAVVAANRPILVERAMYLSTPGRMFDAGHASAATTPSTEWFLAEGATGAFFDLFVLLANPSPTDAAVSVSYLLPDGSAVQKPYTVRANSRFTIWVDQEDRRLADTAVSTVVTSTNGVPIVVERSMWWPGPTAATWAEAHNSAGLTTTGRRWALAEGEVGGAFGTETYILIANRGSADTARVTLYFEDGSNVSKDIPLPAGSRTSVAVAFEFPTAEGKRFATIVESLGATPQIAVERAVYSNAGGVFWAAGTNAVATKLP